MLHMFVFPCLGSFPSLSLSCFSFYVFLYLFAGLFLLSLHVHAWSKGEDASPQRAMTSRLGGLETLERSFLSLSLSLFSRACIRVPLHVPLPFTFPALCLGRIPKVWLIFPVPCWAMPLECWQCLVYFPTLCDSIMYDVYMYIYIYIYMPACVWMIVNFVWWTLVAMGATLSSYESSWPCSMGMCSRQLP